MHQINSPLSTGGCGPAGRCSSLDDSTTSTHQTLPRERLPSWDGLWTALQNQIYRAVCQHLSSILCSGWNTTTEGFCPCASSWERFNECSLQSAVPSAKYVATAVDRNLSPLLSKQWVRQRNVGTVTVRSWTLIAITKKSQTIHFRHCGCCVGAPTGQRAVSLLTPSCAPAAAAAAPPSQSCCWDGAVLALAGQGFQSHNPNRTRAWHH